jgi:hypothetical protein
MSASGPNADEAPPLPPCGIYRTSRALGDHIPAGRLVYFHNHGDPGAGVYLPSGWSANRAQWHTRGHTVPDDSWAHSLTPLPREGLYRVESSFTCCPKNCRSFEVGSLVQLGYDGSARAILFTPVWTIKGLAIPQEGIPIDLDRAASLSLLRVVEEAADSHPLPQ